MKLSIPAGTTSKRIAIFIQDSSSTTGAGLTGLTNASGSLTCYSWIDTDGNAGGTAQALQAATRGTWTTRGFIEKDATNMPGYYEFGIPDALIAAGVKWANIMFKGATNMAPLALEIEVEAVNNQDSVRYGLTALPNAAAEAAGGLYTRGSGAGQIKQTNNGEIDSNVTHINNVVTTPVTTVKAVQGLTTADVIASVTGAVGSVTGAVGSVTGAVGSVTGAVGSVTGNVGGNVVGSVASVTGAIGSVGAGGIAAASFAANAIDNSALATSAVNEIWSQGCTEPTAAVASAPTVVAALSWLLTLARNKITQTATTQTLVADDNATPIATVAVSDDGVTFTRGKAA